MSKQTVWVVEQGKYSDYHVVGVFSSKEYAQQIADLLNRQRDADRSYSATIAEWPLDPAVHELQQGMSRYLVHMLEDGTVERCEPWDVTESGYGLAGDVEIWRRHNAPAYRGKNVGDVLQVEVWATDETHAIKITNEHRTRLIATGEWHAPVESR